MRLGQSRCLTPNDEDRPLTADIPMKIAQRGWQAWDDLGIIEVFLGIRVKSEKAYDRRSLSRTARVRPSATAFDLCQNLDLRCRSRELAVPRMMVVPRTRMVFVATKVEAGTIELTSDLQS